MDSAESLVDSEHAVPCGATVSGLLCMFQADNYSETIGMKWYICTAPFHIGSHVNFLPDLWGSRSDLLLYPLSAFFTEA